MSAIASALLAATRNARDWKVGIVFLLKLTGAAYYICGQ
jgi:hypothetical protein